MKKTKNRLLVVLLTSLVSANCWGQGSEFYRIGCPDGVAPENLTITLDESGQAVLEFDTVDQHTYVIEATDALSAAWRGLSWLTGDGLPATVVTAVRWSRTFGGTYPDLGYSVQETSDGGYIVAGYTDSFGAGYGDVYLVKTDATGREVWGKTLGWTGNEEARSVQETSDGGYIVAGITDSFGAGGRDVYLVKTDEEGDEEWSTTFGGKGADESHSVQQTSDGGYIVAGSTDSSGAGSDDVYLIKTDADGNEVWSKTFGGKGADVAYSVQQTSDGGYIVAGSTDSLGAGALDVYLIKTDRSGNEAWSTTFGGTRNDSAYSVQQTSDGGYIVAGGTASLGAGGMDVYLIKTDRNGNAGMGRGWTKTFGGSGTDIGWSVEQTSDGGYIVAGRTSSFGEGALDVYLIKTEGAREVWSRTFGGDLNDYAYSVQQTSDGGYIVAGVTGSSGAGSDDLYVIKTDRNGNAPPPRRTLLSVAVSGPDEVWENSSADYRATAYWDDGSAQGVTGWASWSTDSVNHDFPTRGHLVTGDANSDEAVTLSASFGGQTGVKHVTVRNVFPWSRTFGGTQIDVAWSVQQTSDGGYIVAGSTESFGAGSKDVYLIMTYANGAEVWSRTFGGDSSEEAYSVQQTTDGGYIVAGKTGSFGAGRQDVYLIKTNADGNELWSRTFGGSAGDEARSVQQTSDGGYILAGTKEFGAGRLLEVYLIKTDADGNEVWSRTFGGDKADEASSVQQTTDGGYIVAGSTESFGYGALLKPDVYLIKTDANGNEVWSRPFGGSESDEGHSVQQTSDGGYIVAGSTESFGAGELDVYLIKTDSDGNEVWSKTFGGDLNDSAYSVQQTSDGGYIIAGYKRGARAAEVCLINTDGDGNEVWSRMFHGVESGSAYSVQQTSDGGYIVAGYTNNFGAGESDVYLIKTDQNGNAPPPE